MVILTKVLMLIKIQQNLPLQWSNNFLIGQKKNYDYGGGISGFITKFNRRKKTANDNKR